MLMRYIKSTFAIAWVFILCLNSADGAKVENILANGGFEDGVMAPWTTYGAVITQVVDKDAIEGRHSLHIKVTGKGANFWDSGLQHAGHVFEKGRKYTLAAFLKSKKNIGLEINFKPELGQNPWPGFGEKRFTMTDTWQEFHTTTPKFADDVVPATITFHIGFQVDEFWIDGVRFFEGDYVPPEDAELQSVQPRNKLATTWGRLKTDN